MSDKIYGYAKKVIWNEPNTLWLYGVDYTSGMRDSVVVFLTQIEADIWIDNQQAKDYEYLGERTTCNKHKKFSTDSEILYSNAERLIIKDREVWIG